MQSITYASGGSVHYTYDDANRVTRIEHRRAGPTPNVILRLDYDYTADDLPSQIIESTNLTLTGGWLETGTTTFSYDSRNRLIAEVRTGQNPYNLEYVYDAGGNREMKIDMGSAERVEYHYDVTPDPGYGPQVYGSLNNRLMWSESIDMNTEAVMSTTYYEYTPHGNVARAITEQSTGPQQQSMTGSGGGETAGGEEGGAPLWGGGGDTTYSAVRFVYAANGQAVTFVHGETWTCGASGCPADYTIDWAREFRYDGARARYMNRPLNPATLWNPEPSTHPSQGTTWTDYDGDDTYGDFTVTTNPLTVTSTDKYEPGLWRRSDSGLSEYLHNDHLGTLRRTSLPDGSPLTLRVFTAFGERKSGTHDRFGYVGAFGYQAHPTQPDFPFLHVGHRYYDPASGRFLQRDPIGIAAAVNVFAYAGATPTTLVDPDGQLAWVPIVIAVVLLIDVVREVAEAPSPEDTRAEMDARRREREREKMVGVGMRMIPWAMLCRAAGQRASSAASSAASQLRPPNPSPFQSPFPPMPKGPFIGGGQPYVHY